MSVKITINIEAKTIEQALDALTAIELSASDELLNQCEELRDQLSTEPGTEEITITKTLKVE